MGNTLRWVNIFKGRHSLGQIWTGFLGHVLQFYLITNQEEYKLQTMTRQMPRAVGPSSSRNGIGIYRPQTVIPTCSALLTTAISKFHFPSAPLWSKPFAFSTDLNEVRDKSRHMPIPHLRRARR